MKIVLVLSNGYTISGPEKNKKEAEELIKEINSEMKSAFEEFEDEGESIAMDERDDCVYEFEEKLSAIDFVIDED